MRLQSPFFGLMVIALFGCSTTPVDLTGSADFAAGPCEVGVYGTGGSFLAITRRDDQFRYTFSDGRVGRISDEDPIQYGEDAVKIDAATVWRKRPLLITDARFDAGDAVLAGQLMEPADAGPDTPLVVYAHGSEELGWIGSARDPYQMVGRGVSVFVYDKRGTGLSTGDYSQNFPQLADDLVAASAEAKRLAKGRYGRFGLFGLSQGGWIVPLAAERAGADFAGIGYGLVVDILEEDAAQVELELREAGYDDDVIAKAKEITDTTALLATSGYRKGLEQLDALRARYGDEPWFAIIRGGFSGVILGMSTDDLRENGIPMFDRLNIDWTLVPIDVLREVDVPQLWVLAGKDREAPIEKTLERLKMLRGEGKDITIYVFPDTDHGMWEYHEAPDGAREYTRVTDGFYTLMADWAKGVSKPPYGKAAQE